MSRWSFVLAAVFIAGATTAARADEPAPRLSVGDPYNADGPKREGLFHGDREVSLDEFLRIAGHDEVADRIRARQRLRHGVMLGGAVIIVGGIAYAVLGEDCDRSIPGPDQKACEDAHSRTQLTGLGVAAAGAGWRRRTPSPGRRRVARHTLRQIARDYNRELRASVWTPAGGAGVVVGGTF